MEFATEQENKNANKLWGGASETQCAENVNAVDLGATPQLLAQFF